LRIRPADFNDGSFEEVRSTANASRDSFYFFTPHDRYYKGIRLLITPASASPTGAWEKVGEVVRVDRQGAGFGVAVVFSKHSTVSGDRVQSPQPGKNERRCAQRQPFVATTEIIDVRTGGRSWMRTADLSMNGCYIDTLNPFPLHTVVRLQIQKENASVEFCARVITCHPGSGMGLVFEGITPTQHTALDKWLGKQLAGVESDFVVSPPAEVTKKQSEVQQRFARLIDILTLKGVLSKSEALSLLQD
jgi:PilZ domain-containing protein